MRWPHEVQKLADPSTSLPHDVQSAITLLQEFLRYVVERED
jgi:hypothetical protein